MLKKYLQKKNLIPYDKIPLRTGIRLSNNDDKKMSFKLNQINQFRKRISVKLPTILQRNTSGGSNLLDPEEGNNKSLLSNFLRKQRLQEYQITTKYFQENPLKSNKRGIIENSSRNSSPKLEKINEINEFNDK